jgi:hypothetical protein
MAITTLDGLIGSSKQMIAYTKTATRTTVATGWYTIIDLAGNPGAGTLAGSDASAGVVPTDATAGTPLINAFGASATGYISAIDFGSSVACRLQLADLLYKAGTFAYNSGTTNLSLQPSFSGRLPGADYSSTQVWMEVSTAFATGNNWTLSITYTNQAGTTGKTSGTLSFTATSALTQGRTYQIPLAAGDSGIQKVESVVCTNAGTLMTAGAINIVILRPLWFGRVKIANDGDTHGPDKTGMPQIYADSALYLQVAADSTSSGIPDLQIEIANG